MSKVKQSHYLPRAAYLSQFSNDGKIWAYNLSAGKDNLLQVKSFETTPKKFGRQNYLYEIPGLPDNFLEKILQPIEDAYQGIFDEKISKHIQLSRKELEIVSLFVATLEVRVPAHKDFWNSQLDELKQRGIELALANNSQEAADRFAEQIELAQLQTFAYSLSAAMKVNRWRFSDFCFIYIEKEEADQYFITSDNPTCLIDYTRMNSFYGIAPSSNTLELTVPISRSITLFVNNAGINGFKKADPNFVREINNRTINHSASFLITPKQLDDNFYNGVYRHYPQSLILRYVELPKGNFDLEVEKSKTTSINKRRINH